MSRTLRTDCAAALSRVAAALDGFSATERWPHAARLFSIGFLGWLMLNTLLLLQYHAHFWSNDAFVIRAPFDPGRPSDWLLNLMSHPALEGSYLLFPLLQIAAIVLTLARVAPRAMMLAVWVLTLNINNRCGMILDGGNNLSELLLFYMLFLNTTGRALAGGNGFLARLRTAATNGAVILIRLQVVAVYAAAGWFKLNGELWQTGMALYYILQADGYTHPFWGALIVKSEWLAFLGTYFAVAFQVTFPFLVWLRRARPFVLAAGVALHLGISTVMGLFLFGLVMCSSYLIFSTDDLARDLLRPRVAARAVLRYLAVTPPVLGSKGSA